MKRFLIVVLLGLFLFAPIIKAQDENKLSDEEKEKLRQELIRIQRQVRTDYQRLQERMQKTRDSIKSLTDPVDKANADKLDRAIALMKELNVAVDMDDLEIKIQNKSYFAAMQLAKEITEKLRKVISALDEQKPPTDNPNIEKLEKAIKKLDELQLEQKKIEEKTEQTFKNSNAGEYQDMMRKTEQLIEKQQNLQKETATMNSRIKEAEQAIEKLEALKKAQSEMGKMTDQLKEGTDLKEKQRLSMLEQILKDLSELIRDQSTQITEITNTADFEQKITELKNVLKFQKDYAQSLTDAEKNNSTLKTYNDIKEIESTIKLILSIRSAEDPTTPEKELAQKLLEPEKKIKELVLVVSKDLSTLVQSYPNNQGLKTALTLIQNSEQDIDESVELLTNGEAKKCQFYQEKTRDAIVTVIENMQEIVKSNVAELPVYAKNLDTLTKTLTELHTAFKEILNKNNQDSIKKQIEKHTTSINSAVISLQAVISQLNIHSSRLAVNDMNLSIDAISTSLDGFTKIFESEVIVQFIKLKASEQLSLKKRLENLVSRLEKIDVKETSDEEKEMLKNSYEGAAKLIEKVKDSANSKIKEYRDNLKQEVEKAKGNENNLPELENSLSNASKFADQLAQELRFEASADSNDLAILSTMLKNLLENTAKFINTRGNANKALENADVDMTKAQEFLAELKPVLGKSKQIDAVENLKLAKECLELELEKSLNKKEFNELSKKQDDLEKKTDEAAKELDKLAQKNSSKNAENAAKKARESQESMKKASENLKKQKSSNAQTSQKQAEKNLQKAIDEMKKEKEDLEKKLGEKSKDLAKKQEELNKELEDLQKQLGNNAQNEQDAEKKDMVEKAQESGKKASENMKNSKKSLEENKSSDSSEQQDKAVEELKNMKEELKNLAEKSLNAEEKLRYEQLQQEQKDLEKKLDELKEELKENSPEAEQNLNKAQDEMKKSEKNLGNQQGKSAQNNQQNAQKQMDKAKKELEKLLRKYEEEQNNELLLHVEQELEKMLKSQILVNQKTTSIKQESEEAGRIDRKLARQLRKVADDQKELSTKAESVSKDLEKGRIPIFAFEMNKVGLDMKEVAEELKTRNVDDYVIEIQEDILRRLKDMLAAIRAERKRRQDDPMPPQQGGGGEMKPRLVPIPAELEILLRKQEYIRAKHEQFMKQFPNLKSREEMTRTQRRIYERLSSQQGLTAKQVEELKKSLFEEE